LQACPHEHASLPSSQIAPKQAELGHCIASESIFYRVLKACIGKMVQPDQLMLHSDNGSPMKGATMLASLQKLRVMPSFSQPSVSDDNP
jgi:putative transposase